jgi:hypothetical protein
MKLLHIKMIGILAWATAARTIKRLGYRGELFPANQNE